MSTQTLQDLRKQKFKTIKEFSIAYGCSTSKASMILQGRHHMVLSKDDVVKLVALFEVPFETCIAACDASYAELRVKNNGSRSNSDKLKWRWNREEEFKKIAEEAAEAARAGNWSFFKFSRFDFNSQDAHRGNHWHTSASSHNDANGSTRFYGTTTPVSSCYGLLGVSQNATEAQIIKAFRQKVKASHDGKGGYTIDMDKLTQAKEQALAGLKSRV